MCVIMLGGGVSGFGKAAKEHNARMAEAQRYEERIETYRQADEKLAGSISYEEAYKVLEELLAEHDDEASQHRTDLAEYSAKKGGYKMAAALIDDAKQQLAEAKAQVEEGKKQLAEKEEQMKFLIELYENNKELVANGISTAADGKAECGTEAARLQAVVDKLNALIAAEPKAPEAPTEPSLRTRATVKRWRNITAILNRKRSTIKSSKNITRSLKNTKQNTRAGRSNAPR